MVKKYFVVEIDQRGRSRIKNYLLMLHVLLLFGLPGILMYGILTFRDLYDFSFILTPIHIILLPIFIVLCLVQSTAAVLFGIKAVNANSPRLLAYLSVTSLLLAVFSMVTVVTLHVQKFGPERSALTSTIWQMLIAYRKNEIRAIQQLNEIQQEFQCCGVRNPQSWLDLESDISTKWSQSIPWSCCRSEAETALPCLHSNYFLLLDNFYLNESTIYEEGCDTAVINKTASSLAPIAWGLLAVSCGQLLIAILTKYSYTSLIEATLKKKDAAKGYLFKR